MNFSILNTNSSNREKGAQDVVSLVDDLLEKAINAGASDVHFEPTGSELAVKFRLDGVLGDVEKLPKSLSDNVIARLKVLGGLLTYRNDIPQEGRIEISKATDAVLDQRLAIFPTINGQRAVVRLFYKNKELMDMALNIIQKNDFLKKLKKQIMQFKVRLQEGNKVGLKEFNQFDSEEKLPNGRPTVFERI